MKESPKEKEKEYPEFRPSLNAREVLEKAKEEEERRFYVKTLLPMLFWITYFLTYFFVVLRFIFGG